MTALDPKRLFDASREVKGAALTQADVDRINAALEGAQEARTGDLALAGAQVAGEALSSLYGAESAKYGPDGFLTPAALIEGYIDAHEGGLSLDPQDHGNYYPAGVLIGSKFGVTGAALAAYRARRGNPEPVNKQTMKELSIDEAVSVGLDGYYERPGFPQLAWNRVTMSAVDMGWGAGPKVGIKLLQRMIGATDDGVIGPQTVAAYTAFLSAHGEEEAARAYGERRDRFYESLNQPRFIKGWRNRTASFLPGTPWWKGAKR